MKNLVLFISLVMLSSVACKSKKKVAVKTEKTETVKKEVAATSPMVPFSKNLGGQLVGKYWKVIEIMGQPVEMPKGMEQEPYLQFHKDGSFKAHGGCNGIFGDYELGFKNFIEISNFSQTEMQCSFDSFEKSFVEALTIGKKYNFIGENEIHLVVGKRSPLAKFKAVFF